MVLWRDSFLGDNMKLIGRIILLFVGVLLIAGGVTSIIADWNAMVVSGGWLDLAAYPEKIQILTSIIMQGINIIFGAVAILAFLRGRATFWLTIFSFIMIAGVVSFYVTSYRAGTLNDWQNILRIAAGFALPLAYFIGSIFIRFK